MFVLDTNTLIYYFKGMGKVKENLLAVPPFAIGIPSIVLFELYTGIAKSTNSQKRQKQLHHLVSLVNILPFGDVEAKCAARIRANLELRGEPIGQYDLLIAATALAHNMTLVTHNIKEFSKVVDLKIVDWY